MQYKFPEKVQIMFRHWLLSSSDCKEKELVLKSAYEDMKPVYDDAKVEEGLRKIHEELSLDSSDNNKKKNIKWIWGVAASLLFCIIFFSEWYFLSNMNESNNKLIYVTAAHSKGEFTLPDGSKVFLNGSSRLICPERFEGDERLVTLEGEGFFDIKHDKHPFIVDTRKISVKVLGTAFDVKCYENRDITQVVLHRGSILLQTKESLPQIVKMKINQKAEFISNKGQLSVNDVCSDYYISWINKKLVFENERLSDILVSLQQWYNMDFIIDQETNLNSRLSFVVRGESVDEILRNISKVAPLKITMKDGTFMISQQK